MHIQKREDDQKPADEEGDVALVDHHNAPMPEGAHLDALMFGHPHLFQEMDWEQKYMVTNDDWELDSLGSRGKPPARPGARRPPPPPTAADRPADRPIPQMRTFGEV